MYPPKAFRPEIVDPRKRELPTFSVPKDAPPITLEMVKAAESDSEAARWKTEEP
jgi:hypothetical protein